MLARTEPACLVIADIAGYTDYLAGVELDHAQDILADLIDTVVGALPIEEILDWQPPHYSTKRIKLPIKGVPRILMTMELVPRGEFTDIVWRVGRPKSAKDRLILKALESEFKKDVARDMANLVPLAEADAAARLAGIANEPAVPSGASRHLTDPVTGPIVFLTDEPAAPEPDPVDSGTVSSSSE